MTVDQEDVVSRLWEALNQQDNVGAGLMLHPDVDWMNLIEGDRCQGRDTVVDYWQRTSAELQYESTPLTFESRPDGRLAARIQHTVRRLDGRIWTDGSLMHIFTFSDGLISRMDAE